MSNKTVFLLENLEEITRKSFRNEHDYNYGEKYQCFSRIPSQYTILKRLGITPKYVKYIPSYRFEENVKKFLSELVFNKKPFDKMVVNKKTAIEDGFFVIDLDAHPYFWVLTTLMMLRYPEEFPSFIDDYAKSKGGWDSWIRIHDKRFENDGFSYNSNHTLYDGNGGKDPEEVIPNSNLLLSKKQTSYLNITGEFA